MNVMNYSSSVDSQLQDTRCAFDSVAADYDGPLGNNALIQRMRGAMRRTLGRLFVPGSRLLDLGCGTGIDAVYLAARGYEIVAADWSPQMVERTRARVAETGLKGCVAVEAIGIHELDHLRGQMFDGIYSDLGPLNCVPDLEAVSGACAALLKSRGRLVVSVMGRHCLWEWAYYAARGVQLNGAPHREPGEIIEVHPAPIAEALAMAHSGQIKDCKSALALLLCEPYLKAEG